MNGIKKVIVGTVFLISGIIGISICNLNFNLLMVNGVNTENEFVSIFYFCFIIIGITLDVWGMLENK